VGSAGAGKTTLLNLLAGRVQNGKIKGSLTVNDIPRNEIGSRRWQRLCSYVMQVRSRL
jgi:ABC-type transport system involved in cytochrome bd biosynthesis fused ATPase/permease subunit